MSRINNFEHTSKNSFINQTKDALLVKNYDNLFQLRINIIKNGILKNDERLKLLKNIAGNSHWVFMENENVAKDLEINLNVIQQQSINIGDIPNHTFESIESALLHFVENDKEPKNYFITLFQQYPKVMDEVLQELKNRIQLHREAGTNFYTEQDKEEPHQKMLQLLEHAKNYNNSPSI